MRYLTHAMKCCKLQHSEGRFWALEHPQTVSSWGQAVTQDVLSLPGAQTMDFDQCMLGLKSPYGTPMRKRTRIMTNCPQLVEAFRGIKCDRNHIHKAIEGSEGGKRLSTHAQVYPDGMVKLIAGVVMATTR